MTMVNSEQNTRFEQMWDRHRSQVLAYCVRRVGPEAAEDACAETFLIAWRRLDDIPAPPDTVLYLYGIARKVVTNYRRSALRRSRLNEKLGIFGVETPDDPGVIVLRSSEDEAVARAVQGLRSRDREIVMLYAWEDLTRDQVAGIMGMTRDAVDQRIHRAYKRLARTLGSRLDVIPDPEGQGGEG